MFELNEKVCAVLLLKARITKKVVYVWLYYVDEWMQADQIGYKRENEFGMVGAKAFKTSFCFVYKMD